MTGNIGQHLKELFTQQLTESGNFLNALYEEREAISHNEIESLTPLVEKKLGIIDKLAKIDIEILTSLRESGAEDSAEGIIKHLEKADPNQQLQLLALWRDMKALAEKCHKENRINSQVVEACNNQVEQTLDILLGRSKSHTYGATGKTIKESGSTIAKA